MAKQPDSMALSTESAPATEASAKQDVVDFGGFELSVSAPPPTPELDLSAEPEPAKDDDSWFGSLFDDDDENEVEKQLERARQLPSQEQFKTAWRHSKKARDPIAAQVLAADTYSTKPVDIEGVEEESGLVPIKEQGILDYTIDKTVKAGGMVLGGLEYGDVPRSEAWINIYKGSAKLPDTGTFYGDILADLTGKGLSGYRLVKDIFEGSKFESEESKDQYYKDLEDLGKNIYSAFADEKLLKKALDTKGYFIDRPDYGPLSGGNATGEDLVNIAFPIDTMKRLKNNAPRKLKPTSTSYVVDVLANPISRAGFGLAMEVVADPLWFVGPAKATQLVSVGNKTYNLGSKGQRAASVLERYSGVTGSGVLQQKRVVKAIIGDADEAIKVRADMLEVADNAAMEAIASQNKAQKFASMKKLVDAGKSAQDAVSVLRKQLNDEVEELLKLSQKYSDPAAGFHAKADYAKITNTINAVKKDIDLLSSVPDQAKLSKMLATKEAHYLNTASAHKGAESTLREFVDLVGITNPKKLGVVEKSKIPIFGTINFSDQTYTFGTGSQIEQVGKKINQLLGDDSIIISKVGDIKTFADDMSPSTISSTLNAARALGVDSKEALSEGQQLFKLLYDTGNAVGQVPRFIYDSFAKILGTRRLQPYFASQHIKDNMSYYGTQGAYSVGLSATNSNLVRIQRLRPELWENYQNSVENHAKQIAALHTFARREIGVLYKLAGGKDGKGGALAEWKNSIETREIPLLEQEISALVQDISKSSDPSQIRAMKRELRYKRSVLEERQQVLSDDYTVIDFVNEAAHAVETGAGKIQENPWLKPAIEKWASVRDEIVSSTGKTADEVDQALVAMLRFFSGNEEAAAATARRMLVLDQTTRGVKPEQQVRSNIELINAARKIKLTSMDELLNELDPNKLTEIVYRTLDIDEKMPFGEERAQAIYNAVLKAVDGDEDIADELLMYAAGAYGGTPEEALRLFAMDVSGDLKRVAEQAGSSPSILSADDLKMIHQGGAHPRRWEKHPEIDIVPPDLTIEEFVSVSKNQPIEYGAVYDAENGLQVASAKGTKDGVNIHKNINKDFLDELVSKGTAVSVHNHPSTSIFSGEYLETIGDDVLDSANYFHHESKTHGVFSFKDLVAGIALNEQKMIVVNPDGSLWVLERPANGWIDTVPPELTKYQERLRHLTIDSGLHLYLEKLDEKVLSETYFEMQPTIRWFEGQISDLKDALSSGAIDKKRYDQLLKRTKESGAQFVLSKAQELLNNKILDELEDTFGTRPYRTVAPGRYSSSGPVRRLQQEDSFKSERSLLKRRLRSSIEDKKVQTKAALEEIRNFRLGITKPEDFVFNSHDIGRKILVEKVAAKRRIEETLFRKFNYEDLNEIPDDAQDFVQDLVGWIESDYPLGVPVDTAAKKARTTAEWRNEKLDALGLEDWSVDEIDKLKDDFISIRNMDASVADRFEQLTGIQKRLGSRRVDQTLQKQELKKRARKLRKQRIDTSVRQLVDGAPDFDTAKSRVREMLDEAMDLPPGDIYTKLKDDLAESFTKNSYNTKIKTGEAAERAKVRGRTLLEEEFEKMSKQLKEEIPKLKIPNVDPKKEALGVALKDWEIDVYNKFKDVFSTLDEKDAFLVAYGALADTPKIPKMTDQYIGIQERYKSLIGQRLGEIPEELRPIRDALKSLVKHYEDLYEKYGMNLVKSPEEMMRFWGVIDYVPHKKLLPADMRPGERPLSTEYMGNLSSLASSISRDMPQKKRRLISGTIAEINASGGSTRMGISPTNLMINYGRAAKSIAGQDFMLSMIAGGVLKPISSKPVYDNMLEKLATKYNLVGDVPLEDIPPNALDVLVREKASKRELEALDAALERVTDDLVPMIPAYERAAEMGYVPLFDRAVKSLSNDIIVNGSRSDWAGMIDEDILRQFEEIASYPQKMREDQFAKYIRETPSVRAADEIIALLGKIKMDDFNKGRELYDPVTAYNAFLQEEKLKKGLLLSKRGKSPEDIASTLINESEKLSLSAWSRVAKEMNARSSELKSSLTVKDPAALKAFYSEGAEMWKLYVPATVKQSMDDIFSPRWQNSEFAKSLPVQALRRFNNFWKLRTTIVAAAFHVRNYVSNQFSMMLDSGVASMGPAVAADAGRLATLSHVYDRYGSIEAAKKVMSMRRGSAESAFQYKKRQIGLDIINQLDRPGSMYDIGDGVMRTADDSIKVLQERGVIAGGMQQYIDINTFEQSMSEIYTSAGQNSVFDKAKKFGSLFEDAVITGVPNLIAGSVLPIGIPKKLGSVVGRNIENQARIATFIVNTKKTGSFDTAAKQVDKFLFDYDDLTPFQKDWMRLVFPFFTWTQKNVVLQLKMLQENPVFYSQMQRLLIHQGPELVEKYNAETLGIPYVPRYGSSPQQLALRDEHARNMIRFPVPGKPGYYVEGLGLPQEAFFEQMNMIQQAISSPIGEERFDNRKQHLRMLGQTHYMFKTFMELAVLKHNTFMDMPIVDATNGRRAMEVIDGVRRMPIIGQGVADYIVNEAGITVTQPWNAKKGMFMDDVHINGTANYLISNHPWSRVLNDAAGVAMLYNMTYLDRLPADMRLQYSTSEYEPIPSWLKIADAMGGIRIIADNPQARKARIDYEINQRYKEAFRRAGITGEFEIQTIRKQQ